MSAVCTTAAPEGDVRTFWIGLCVSVVIVAIPGSAAGQGCVCQKQGLPVFGGLETYLYQGQWLLTVGYRGYESTEHFQGTEPFPALDPNGPLNEQHQVIGELTYALTDRWNISVGGPWYQNGFAVRRAGPAAQTPYFQDTPVQGFGDFGARARYWLFSTERPDRNVGLSGGVKFPTGKADRTGTVGGRTVPADVSIQTGDRGWGFTAGVQAFQEFKRGSVYGTMHYLFNPRNTTGVPTFFGSLNNPNNTVENSAADQHSSQIGGAFVVKQGWPVPSLTYRIEGVPVHDAFGESDGFRRPGVITFIEPGINMQLAGNLLSFSVAIRQYVNIKDSPTSTRREDATVPKYMFLAGYARRF
jgi:hypothetical protein